MKTLWTATCLILFSAIGVVVIVTALGQTAPAAPQPTNVAQDGVAAAMLDACKGAARIRFDQAVVNEQVDDDGFRLVVLRLRACRDKLFIAVSDPPQRVPQPKAK
jgi:hypothetical protein